MATVRAERNQVMSWLRTNGYMVDIDGPTFMSSDGGGGDFVLWQEGEAWRARWSDAVEERLNMTIKAQDLDEAIDKAEIAIESWWKEPDLERDDPDRDDL